MRKDEAIRELGAELFALIEQGEVVALTSEESNYDERDPAVAERICRRNGRDIECSTLEKDGYHVLYEDVFED